MGSDRQRAQLHIAGLCAALVALLTSALGDLSAHVPLWLVACGVGFLPIAAVLALTRSPLRPPSARATVLVVLGWALLIRLPLLLFTDPTLSDDIFRYVWEGRMVAGGLDPYDLAPNHPALTRMALDAPEWSLINHRELPAIYPAATQWVFGALASVSATTGFFRAAMVAVDAALICTLGALLHSRGRDPRWLVLYAWHPLVAVEVASSGHYEPLALLALVGGLLAWESPRRGVTPWLLWGLAIATKYIGGAAAWFAARRLVERGHWPLALLGLVTAGLCALLFALPFALDGRPPIGSLGTYVQHWGHNASVHALLTELIGYHPARKVVALLFVLWAAWLTWTGPEPARAFLLLFAGLMVLSPVVHPWYGLWLIALLPLVPSPPLIALSALLPLSYLAWTTQASGGGWVTPAWVPWVEYGVPLMLALALPASRSSSPRR